VVIAQGDVWWADLAEPRGSAAGFRRPVVVVQADALNRSALATTVVVPLTSNLKWQAAPGNVPLGPKDTGLRRESVALVAQVTAIDKGALVERTGKVSGRRLQMIHAGIDVVLGR
jgi:mRNA interferase MazF